MNVTIRTAQTGDQKKLRPMQREIATLHFRARPDLFREGAPVLTEEAWKELLTDPESTVLVAETEEGSTVGYVFAKIISFRNHPSLRDFDCFYIDDLCVLSSHQRQGIGRMLMEKCKEIAKSSGCRMIDLNVWAFNQGAIAFYESLGMQERTARMELRLEE